eukprot:5402495-Amphidinium_carterae.1
MQLLTPKAQARNLLQHNTFHLHSRVHCRQVGNTNGHLACFSKSGVTTRSTPREPEQFATRVAPLVSPTVSIAC